MQIPDGTILEGNIPNPKMKLLQAWIELHKDELVADWELGTCRFWRATIQDRPIEVIRMNPRVKSVSAIADYKLKIQFTNDEEGIYDCTPLLDFGVFKELQDIDYFKQAKAWDGTVVWPHEQDICPDTLYLDSIKNAEQAA